MIELFEQDMKSPALHSSKGNQLKWEKDGIWYKADYTGYEGLAEYVVSKLLAFSTLDESEYVQYDIEEIHYGSRTLFGVKSRDILTEDWQIITLERLYKNKFNQGLNQSLWEIQNIHERMQFLCSQTARITGIPDFGKYMTKLFTIDAFFLNEDRHTHNIAILMNSKGEFRLCPIFDNGAALLSDIRMDYPLDGDLYQLMDSVHAKTISTDFDEQLEIAEELFGQQIHFYFTRKDVNRILDSAKPYSEPIKSRVQSILFEQMRKYPYLFT